MDNRKFKNPDFKVAPWLKGAVPRPLGHHYEDLPPEIPHDAYGPQAPSAGFSPASFVIPGWQGEGLLSKNAIKLRKLLHDLEKDARQQILKATSFPQSRKQQIYQEFLDFKEEYSFECKELQSFINFWQHFGDEHSDYRDVLNKFRQSFCYRSVLIYLNKVRFLVFTTRSLSIDLDPRDLGSINNLISRIFVKGSSTQLQCDSLRPNQYSWYLPSEKHRLGLHKLIEPLTSISVTELNKIFSTESKNTRDSSDDSHHDKDLDLIDDEYSHALSHRSFGLFLNKLLIELPNWIKEPEQRKKHFTCFELEPRALSTKFSGDYLKAFTLSHWLAQEHNLGERWSQLICPDFVSPDYKNGFYLQILHELQFLSFIIQLAHAQNHDPLSLVCRLMREKYSNSAHSFEQIPLWNSHEVPQSLHYKRLVLNLTNLPRKNPHHFLLTRITQESKSLSRDGLLYVFSNQKLFVPSHSDRVSALLKNLKLEAHFCFEHLKGKGEVANYLYIFTKRNLETLENTFIPTFKMASKESCLSFRWSGDLTRFNKFEKIVAELHTFFRLKDSQGTPIYRTETEDGLSFDFHQDAVFEGKLSSAHSTKDSPQITHPIFFKNFTKSSVHLEQFFQIEALTPPNSNPQQESSTNSLLGIPFSKFDRYPLVLIVDFQDLRPRIELISYDMYHAKFNQYGSAYFRYFGLLPKRNDININTFKEYFNSRLGLQIIEFCLNGGQANIKSKLKSLLVPRFFENCLDLPDSELERLKFFGLKAQELLHIHPAQLKASSVRSFQEAKTFSKDHPWFILGLLSSLKTEVSNALLEFSSKEKSVVDYSNPLILEPLLRLPSKSLYRDNEDLHLEFLISEVDDLRLALTDLAIKKDADNYFLKLSHDGKSILSIYGQLSLLEFIKFVFSSALGTPVSLLIQNSKVPKAKDLEHLLENYQLVEAQLEEISEQIERSISDLFHQHITNS